MTTPTEFFNWWIIDQRTSKRRLTTYKLTRIDAERAFPGAEREHSTGEVRNLPDNDQFPSRSRPGSEWSQASRYEDT